MPAPTNNVFNSVAAQYLQKDSAFYSNVSKAHDILCKVRNQSDGHGITFVVRRNEYMPSLDRRLRNAKQYNEESHLLDDQDIVEVVADHREVDLATIVNNEGQITAASVYLPADDLMYQDKYGIQCDISTFLGYAPDEDGAGGRAISSLCASDMFNGDVAILTLGETSPTGKKGEINLYFQGDRLYNSKGRAVRWDLADPLRLPKTRRQLYSIPYLSESTIALTPF
ncbi:MAG: hypothetical protein V1729_07305 [Candidatus Woesearchaeota archaeon]